MIKKLLERCGLVVGEVEVDPRLEVAAERIEESLTEWSSALKDHIEAHAQMRPPAPMRRIK